MKAKLPRLDSIQELAKFWDTHDVMDFDAELVQASAPVFVRKIAINVPLESNEVEAVERLAKARGVSREELVRSLVLRELSQPRG